MLSCDPATIGTRNLWVRCAFRVVAEAIEGWSWFDLYVLPIFVFGKVQPVILCFAVHKVRTATITCKLSTTDFGERTKWMQRVVDMLKTVLWTNWSLYLRAIVCTTIVDKSRPPFHANHWCDCCRFVPDLPVAIIVEFAAIGWDSRAHALLSAARVVSKSPFCNVGGCCCQIFTFKALLQINRKYQHVDVGLTPIGDKLCVKVVDSVHVVHMSIYELRQLKHFTFTHTHQKKSSWQT